MTLFRAHRVATPAILQLEAVECGAAALGSILGCYGRHVPLAELREACGVSRDGSTASNLLKAARRYGLEAKGYTVQLDAVRDLQFPFIVFWNFNHFLVVEGFRGDKVYLNDPASGHRTVSWSRFDAGFTGVVLILQPGPDFQRGGRRPTAVPGLWRRLRGNVPALAFCALAGLLLVLPGLAMPTFTQVFLDGVIIQGRHGWFRPLIIAMFATAALQLILNGIQLLYLRRLRLSLAAKLNAHFLWHLLRLPMRFYAQRFPGEIVARSALNDKVAETLSGQLARTVVDLFTMVAYALVMLYYSLPLTAIGVGFALVNFVVLRWMSARRVETNMRLAQDMGRVQATTIAGLQSIETLKAAGIEGGFLKRWYGQFAKASNARQQLEYSEIILGLLPTLLSTVITILILIAGAFQVIAGEMTIGMLVAFLSLMASFLAPVSALVDLGAVIQELQGDVLRLDDVLENPATVAPALTLRAGQPSQASLPEVRLAGALELRDVSFGYSRLEAPLIRDFSLRVEPGQRVALVGGSGSGKSTIAKLVCGLYAPWSGEILFDDRPRSEIPAVVMANSLAFVDQDVMLFEAPVRDNLCLWDRTVPDRTMWAACSDAAVQEVVSELPGGLDGQLLEGGANLSGGQRQRLEIARALINDPVLLVLDEATSALDAETEAVIDSNFRRRGCTCLIVAHRLSTIRDCDEIVVLDEGRIVQRGTHEQLWTAEGLYRELLSYQEQAGALDE